MAPGDWCERGVEDPTSSSSPDKDFSLHIPSFNEDKCYFLAPVTIKDKAENKMSHQSSVLPLHAPSFNNIMFSAQINLSFAPNYYFASLSAEAERGLTNEPSSTVTPCFPFCSLISWRSPPSHKLGALHPPAFARSPGLRFFHLLICEALRVLQWGEFRPIGKGVALIFPLLRTSKPAQLLQGCASNVLQKSPAITISFSSPWNSNAIAEGRVI